jgi:hypothetical protein
VVERVSTFHRLMIREDGVAFCRESEGPEAQALMEGVISPEA